MITIIDYRMGNLGSIRNMFQRLGQPTEVTNDPAVVRRATRLFLPGVGHFSNGSEQFHKLGLEESLNERVLKGGVPLLGICVGHQLLCDGSDEGPGRGLGWVHGRCQRFEPVADSAGRRAAVPQMGWNHVAATRVHPVLDGLDILPRFYFANSYWMACQDRQDVLLESMYGGERFTAAVAKDNLVGVQFHPEKSHRFGMRLLDNFARWTPQ